MKSNLLHLFDKVRAQPLVPFVALATHAALCEQIATIAMQDRGIALPPAMVARVADAIVAARCADRRGLMQIRATLA